jgi:hypothetical protein
MAMSRALVRFRISRRKCDIWREEGIGKRSSLRTLGHCGLNVMIIVNADLLWVIPNCVELTMKRSLRARTVAARTVSSPKCIRLNLSVTSVSQGAFPERGSRRLDGSLSRSLRIWFSSELKCIVRMADSPMLHAVQEKPRSQILLVIRKNQMRVAEIDKSDNKSPCIRGCTCGILLTS